MTNPSTVVPKRETSDTPTLASWYYGEGLYSHYRKVMLAACRESIRASAAVANTKITESRLDDLAHVHSAYLSFLADHLDGRREWLAHYIQEGGLK